MITSISPIRDASLGGGFSCLGALVQKIFPVYRRGRFYNSASNRWRSLWIPSITTYIQAFFQQLLRTQKTFAIQREQLPTNSNYCVWIGHATFLMHIGTCTIITDPIFGHATWLFKRITPPGIDTQQLPPINYVLISHNHRDHMDEQTIKTLVRQNPKITFLVPLGVKKWFLQRSITKVHEYSWWESISIPGAKCTFLPAYHWSGRNVIDRNETLWGSWMIESTDLTIYFAGDTAYWKHFACIGKHFPTIDIALLPIAPCKPFSFMQKSHLNASAAVQAFLDLGAKHFIAMHWGTFRFGTDDIETPLFYLKRAWNNKKIPDLHNLTICRPGQVLSLIRSSLLRSAREVQLIP